MKVLSIIMIFTVLPKLALSLIVTGVPTKTCNIIYRNIGIYNLPNTTTVKDIKTKIFEESGVEVEKQQLFFGTTVYDDETTIDKIQNFGDMSTVTMQLKEASPAQ